MNRPEWVKKCSTQEWIMIAVIVMLLIMVSTRWGYTTHMAGEAFRQRFAPPSEQAGTTSVPDAGSVAE